MVITGHRWSRAQTGPCYYCNWFIHVVESPHIENPRCPPWPLHGVKQWLIKIACLSDHVRGSMGRELQTMHDHPLLGESFNPFTVESIIGRRGCHSEIYLYYTYPSEPTHH